MRETIFSTKQIVLGSLILGVCASLICYAVEPESATSNERIRFNDSILPLFSNQCFACHGPDAESREAGLRLDRFDDATRSLASGFQAISPGKPNESELLARIEATDAQRMPPREDHSGFSREQVQLIRTWIEQGADYQSHWSFRPVEHVVVPSTVGDEFSSNEIDAFVVEGMRRRGFAPSPISDPRTLIRRVSLDLTGLPPDPKRVDELLRAWSGRTYQNYVDELLMSPHYGQHMAVAWLDAARYADTNGYQHDNQRDMWPWRDWVINALNENMPYDQFAIEQLAGDLLPDATHSQRLATGFNRNHGLNFEGGSVAAESQVDYVVDRTNTFGTVFMGLTIGCAQCHDHKFDPISQRDFYGMFAFFNRVDEDGFAGELGNAKPTIPIQWADFDKQFDDVRKQLDAIELDLVERLDRYDDAQASWENDIRSGRIALPSAPPDPRVEFNFDAGDPAVPTNTGSQIESASVMGVPHCVERDAGMAMQFDGKTRLNCGNIARFAKEDAFSFGAWVNANEGIAAPIMGRSQFHGYDLVWQYGTIRANFVNRWDINAIFVQTREQFSAKQWHHVLVTYDGSGNAEGVTIYVDGVPVETEVLKNDLTGEIESETDFFIGTRNHESKELFSGTIDDVQVFDRRLTRMEVEQLSGRTRGENLASIVNTDNSARDPAQARSLREYYLQQFDEDYTKKMRLQTELKRTYYECEARRLTSMVMSEMPIPRETRVLVRGRYDQPAASVVAQTPAIFADIECAGDQPNRLDLARWLVSGRHPLTARVAVNRYWQHFFGRGIVATPEDFGLQGEHPSHPQLLDWLASEFVESGWDTKHMHRLMVTSATYQQSSVVNASSLEGDPDNIWLSRFSRRRLAAEVIHDAALFAAQQLDDRLEGPSVMPPQPTGLWQDLSFLSGQTAQTYQTSSGADAYRRSVYTFIKRSCPPPNLSIFDAAERAVCSVRRSTTNTPLQALVLLNDPIFVEAAVQVALHADRHSTSSEDCISSAFERCMSREASVAEMKILYRLYEAQLVHWTVDNATAMLLNGIPADELGNRMDDHQLRHLAALSSVVQVIQAMDETISVN